jgi:hypothetical protein
VPHDNLIENLIPHLSGWFGTIKVILVLCGFILFLFTLMSFSKKTERRLTGRSVMALIASMFLINIGAFLDIVSRTLLGDASIKSLSYQAPEHPAKHYIQFAIYLAAIVGLIAIGRGVLMLKDFDSQKGSLSIALTHIFGGILCVNLVSTLKIMGRSLGRDVLDLITAITG